MEFIEEIKARLADLAEQAPHHADPRVGIVVLTGIVSDLIAGLSKPEESKAPEA